MLYAVTSIAYMSAALVVPSTPGAQPVRPGAPSVRPAAATVAPSLQRLAVSMPGGIFPEETSIAGLPSTQLLAAGFPGSGKEFSGYKTRDYASMSADAAPQAEAKADTSKTASGYDKIDLSLYFEDSKSDSKAAAGKTAMKEKVRRRYAPITRREPRTSANLCIALPRHAPPPTTHPCSDPRPSTPRRRPRAASTDRGAGRAEGPVRA